MAKCSFFFATFVFFLVAGFGVGNEVEINALFIRASIYFTVAFFVGIIVCAVIAKSLEEEIIVLKEREAEEKRRKAEELKRQEEEREKNPEHYI